MTQFMGLMTDPFVAGRGDGTGGHATAMPPRTRYAYAGSSDQPTRRLAAIYRQGAAGADL